LARIVEKAEQSQLGADLRDDRPDVATPVASLEEHQPSLLGALGVRGPPMLAAHAVIVNERGERFARF
jgi:hypothetical protein